METWVSFIHKITCFYTCIYGGPYVQNTPQKQMHPNCSQHTLIFKLMCNRLSKTPPKQSETPPKTFQNTSETFETPQKTPPNPKNTPKHSKHPQTFETPLKH